MDPLAPVLGSVHLQRRFLRRPQLRAPWGFDTPAQERAAFHFVAEGEAVVGLRGNPPMRLLAGDVAFYPHGDAHYIASDAEAPRQRTCEAFRGKNSAEIAQMRVGPPDGARAVVQCGTMTISGGGIHPLFGVLPRMVVLHDAARRPERLLLVRWLLRELASQDPGAWTTSTRILDILLIEGLRASASDTDRTCWLAGLRDERIARAIAAIHNDPARAWTVSELGALASMSRATFAATFTRLVGEPPIAYLTRWRLHTAECMLRDPSNTLADIAEATGYNSRASFGRVFKKWQGASPGQWRRDALRSDPTERV